MYNRCCSLVQIGTGVGKRPFCSCLAYSGAYFKALFLLTMEKFKDLCHSRGCFGCFTKQKHKISVEEPSKGLKIQDRGAAQKSSSLADDFFSSSTFEMDNNTSAVQSQRSASSISTSNQPLDPHSGPSNDPPEFINHGLLLWNQTRQQWVGNKASSRRTPVQERRISWNATYDSLLGSNKPFPKPVPLSEMISFLYNVWEQEGLYD